MPELGEGIIFDCMCIKVGRNKVAVEVETSVQINEKSKRSEKTQLTTRERATYIVHQHIYTFIIYMMLLSISY